MAGEHVSAHPHSIKHLRTYSVVTIILMKISTCFESFFDCICSTTGWGCLFLLQFPKPASHQVMTGPPHKVPSLPGCPRAPSVEMLGYPLQRTAAVPRVPLWRCHCGTVLETRAHAWDGSACSTAGILPRVTVLAECAIEFSVTPALRLLSSLFHKLKVILHNR